MAETLLERATRKAYTGGDLTPEEESVLAEAGKLAAQDEASLFGVGADALRPLFRRPKQEMVSGVDPFANISMGNLRQEGRDSRLREGTYPDSNRTVILPEGKPQMFDPYAEAINALNVGRVGAKTVSDRYAPYRAEFRQGYDELAARKAPELEQMDMEPRLRALYEANKRPTRDQAKITDDQERMNWFDAALRLFGAASDPNSQRRGFLGNASAALMPVLDQYGKQKNMAYDDLVNAQKEALSQGVTLIDASGKDVTNRNALREKQDAYGRRSITDKLEGVKSALDVEQLSGGVEQFNAGQLNAAERQNAALRAKQAELRLAQKLKLEGAEEKPQDITKAIDMIEKYYPGATSIAPKDSEILAKHYLGLVKLTPAQLERVTTNMAALGVKSKNSDVME